MKASSVTCSVTQLKVSVFLQDREFRCEAETTKSRVSWDTEMCCFLDEGGTNRLALHIAHSFSCLTMMLPINFQF